MIMAHVFVDQVPKVALTERNETVEALVLERLALDRQATTLPIGNPNTASARRGRQDLLEDADLLLRVVQLLLHTVVKQAREQHGQEPEHRLKHAIRLADAKRRQHLPRKLETCENQGAMSFGTLRVAPRKTAHCSSRCCANSMRTIYKQHASTLLLTTTVFTTVMKRGGHSRRCHVFNSAFSLPYSPDLNRIDFAHLVNFGC